jgi:hypothetical protein
MRIDLVIDAACPSTQADAPAARYLALERFIARGEPWELDAGDLVSTVRALFALPPDQHLPAAALSLLGEDIDPGSDDWLRLEPVHFEAGHARVTLVPLPTRDLEPAETQALQEALAPHLAACGYEFVADRSHRWYLRSHQPLALRTQPPRACAGLLDETHLPAGPDGAALRRLSTEAQMLLHALPVNEAREASGKLAVNGIWPWGNGRMTPLPRSRYTRVYSDDPLVRGIGRASGARAGTLPDDAVRMLAESSPDDNLLTVCSLETTPLATVEAKWALPLAQELSAGRAEEIGLVLAGAAPARAARVTRRHLRRWWRRSRPLAHA